MPSAGPHTPRLPQGGREESHGSYSAGVWHFMSLSWQEQRVPYPKLDFSAQELREYFQQQLQMELDSTVTIESVESTKPITPQAIKAVKLRDWREGGSVQPLGPVGGAGLSDSGLLPGDTHRSVLPLCLCSANCWPRFAASGMTPCSRPCGSRSSTCPSSGRRQGTIFCTRPCACCRTRSTWASCCR